MSTLAMLIWNQWLCLVAFKKGNERMKYSYLILKLVCGLKSKQMVKDHAQEPVTLQSSTKAALSFSGALKLKIGDSTIHGF